MRYIFGSEIGKLAAIDKKIIVLVGDIGYGVFDEFRQNFPHRFINIGICEQSMISVAAGMALQGLKPYVYTITPFLIERAFEQIKLDIDAQNTNVTLVGYADYPNQGITHRELNAKALMSLLSNINTFLPTNEVEAKLAIQDSYNRNGPSFISLKSL